MVKIGHIELGEFPLLLAPMEDVTDISFRKICKHLGADLMFTEFISSEGLIRNARKSLIKLAVTVEERPIGIQIFGHDLNSMKHAAEKAEKANPDLIDLNFGCPVRKVVNKGGGAALLLDIPKMIKITEVVVKSTSLPVTVKTRLGWDEKNKIIVDVAEKLQDAGVQAITIHGRTRSQVYSGKSDWTLIGEVKNNRRMKIPVFGNGDIDNPEIALDMKQKYNVDGIMIGRASIGNPWIFRQIKAYFENKTILPDVGIAERISVCKRHITLSVKEKGERTGILEMRKHYRGYFSGIYNFKQHKIALMKALTYAETEEVLLKIEQQYQYKADSHVERNRNINH